MPKPIHSATDYLLGQAQLEADIAQQIVEKIRQNDNNPNRYYEEKLALKMLDFFKQEERVITLYVEAKENYPILAEVMENKRPYLRELLSEAKRLYEKSLLEK